MQRFLVPDLKLQDPNHILLPAHEAEHAIRSLRMKEGHVVELIDGQGLLVKAVLSQIDKSSVWAKTVTSIVRDEPFPPAKIHAAMAVISLDPMELALQKCCELGVTSLTPIIAKRCVAKLEASKWPSRKLRWQRIIEESCKQSGRAQFMRLGDPMTVNEYVSSIPGDCLKLIASLSQPVCSLSEIKRYWHDSLMRSDVPNEYVYAIGPEGDWTPEEERAFIDGGFKPVSLGGLVLRAETAVIYTASVLKYISEDYEK